MTLGGLVTERGQFLVRLTGGKLSTARGQAGYSDAAPAPSRGRRRTLDTPRRTAAANNQNRGALQQHRSTGGPRRWPHASQAAGSMPICQAPA